MSELVLLQGSPGQRGEQLGRCQKELLQRRVADLRTLCDKNQIQMLELADRARQLTTAVNLLGPDWITEARALASAAQVPAAGFFAVTYPPEKVHPSLLPKRANDSTAFGIAGAMPNIGGILHANCDGPDIAHHVLARASSAGTLAYVALAEAADIGIKAFVNEAGLAGVCHIGPPVEDHTPCAAMPGLVLRHICERATSCAQALAEFDASQKRTPLAAPDKRGVCYLFADSTGEVMLLEASSTRFQHYRVTGAFIIAASKFQLGQPMQSAIEPFRQRHLRTFLSAKPPTLDRVLQAARLDQRAGAEKGVCDADTRASFVAALGRNGAPSCALIALGTPLYNIAVPVFPRVGPPAGMVDGSFFTGALRAPDGSGARDEKREAYESILLDGLERLSASSPDADLAAFSKDMWDLAAKYVEPVPEQAAAEPPE